MDSSILGLIVVLLIVSLAAVAVEAKARSPFYYVALATAILAVTALGIYVASNLATLLVLGQPLSWSTP